MMDSPIKAGVYYDKANDSLTIAHSQDTASVFDENKRLQNLNDGYGPTREIRRVASIPPVVLMIWCKEDGLNFLNVYRNWKRDPALKRWMRSKIYDPDNSFVLTAPRYSKKYV